MTIDPINLEWHLNCTPSQAFDAFVNDIHTWWPTDVHSVGQDKVANVTFEDKIDGRIYETQTDGTESNWGRVLDCTRGKFLSFLWHPGREENEATRIVIEFHQDNGTTRMTLEHSGWKGDTAEAARASYFKGWQFVIGECYCARLKAA